MPTFGTAGDIIRKAGVELGLISGSYTGDPYGETEENILLLVQLLESLGQELVGEFEWSQLRREWEQATTGADGDYPLPAGFDRVVDQTAWDATTQLPLGGPISAQERQLIKAHSASGVVILPFHILGNTLYLEPAASVPNAHTLQLEYVTEYWVAATGETTTTKAAPTLQTDDCWFPRLLLIKGLRWKFREAKGFDTTAELQAYVREKEAAMGKLANGPVLSLNGNLTDPHFLDSSNIPESGFGS